MANKKHLNQLRPLIISLRPYQWIKNLSIFAAIIFNGQLFNINFFYSTVLGFITLCLLSSASYLFNDIIDAPYDRLHPLKKSRPIARGDLNINTAFQYTLLLLITGLILAFFLNHSFFIIALTFISLHIIYSLVLKKHALFDILGIAASFILRVYSGEALTTYHIPIWLMLSVVFLSLFIASGKRRSEFVKEGSKTRPALIKYQRKLLDFYLSTFANATLLCYSLFAFTAQPPIFRERIFQFFLSNYPKILDRKWLMATIPFVILGIMRYAQMIYLTQKGEQPEKALVTDRLLLLTILGWGTTVITLIYVL